LRGEHPIYYYNQPYMGSFEAYIMAGIFFFSGPSVWAFRVEPILISLVLVVITWRFATVLADATRLTQRAKTCFVTIATLIAAFPPLYDTVEEMRGTGGYIEVFTVMLWLLFCTWRLTYRWQNNASPRELLLRWAGIGFLIGFGLWLDPLVAYGLAAIALWIGIFLIMELIKPKSKPMLPTLLRKFGESLLAAIALPAALVGFSPGLYWGLHHQWANIAYIFTNGSEPTSQNKLATFLHVEKAYLTCLAPRAIGGALPTQPEVTVANPHIITLGLVVGAGCLFVCSIAFVFSWVWPQTILTRIRRLTALPLLFFLCVSVIFGTASIAARSASTTCGPNDAIGRYTVPLVTALPFFIAAVLTVPLIIGEKEYTLSHREEESDAQPGTRFASPKLSILSIGILIVLVPYFVTQSIAYKNANPGYTFQETGSAVNYPANNDSIIAYMEREHIHYVWGTGWIGDSITFKTDGNIVVGDPHGRIKSNDDAVLHAKYASIILLVRHSDAHPAFLKALDVENVQYRIGRFYSEPGVDALVITPLNCTLSLTDPRFASVFTYVFSNPF
jgi:hypothetical protein